MSKTTYECCLELPDIYTFTDGQKYTRALQGLLIFDGSESSSDVTELDGEEIVLELPDVVHLLVHVSKVSITIQLIFL